MIKALWMIGLLLGVSWAALAEDVCVNEPCTVASADPAAGLTAAEIAAIQTVTIPALEPNTKLMHDRRYMRVKGATEIFDAPNGTVLRVLDPGFVFITAYADQDGWTQINPNEWVKTEQVANTNWVVSSFTGLLLPETLPAYQLAWALVDVYPSAAPGVEPPSESDTLALIQRYSLLSIYATVEIDGFRWYQIGVDQWIHQYNVAKVQPLTALPTGVDTQLWFGIDLYEQVIIAYEGTRPIFATLIATGLPRWPTYEGLFHIYYRNEREQMSWGVVGDDYYLLEEVPWTMFFDEGRALHGAYWHDGFGYRRSHGCVNMTITDAKWIYDKVAEFMGPEAKRTDLGPAVYVYSSDTYR